MDGLIYEEDEIQDYIISSVEKNKTYLLREQDDEIDYLNRQLSLIRKKTKDLQNNEDNDVAKLDKDILELRELIDSLRNDVQNIKLRLQQNEQVIASNTNTLVEHTALINELFSVEQELKDLSKRIKDMEFENQKITAYLTDRQTLHLDYSSESKGLYSYLPYDSSVNDALNKSLKTDEQKDAEKLSYSKCSKHVRCFSISASTYSHSDTYSIMAGSKTLVTIGITNDEEQDFLTFTIDDGVTKVQNDVPKTSEYGENVYTFLMEYQLSKNSPRIDARPQSINKLSIMILSDMELLKRAYDQKDTHYMENDIVRTVTMTISLSTTDMLDIRLSEGKIPLLLVATKYYGIADSIDFATAHFTTRQVVTLLLSIQQLKIDEERKQLYDEINYDDQNDHVLANLMLDVNMLKANSVRAVTTAFSINESSSISLALQPILAATTQIIASDYALSGQPADSVTWWSASDPYFRYSRMLNYVYEIPQTTIEVTQWLQFNFKMNDLSGTTTGIANGRMRCYAKLDDDTQSNVFSLEGKSFYDYFIHVPTGRDEIASTNNNNDISNQFRLEPSHTGTSSQLYFTSILGPRTPLSITISIYPAEVLPLTSKILDSKNFIITIGDEEYEVNTSWDTKVERDGATERIVIIAVLDLSSIFSEKQRACIPIASHDFGTLKAKQVTSVVRKWADSGDIYATNPVNLSSGAKVYGGVRVTNPAGGHSLARPLLPKITTASTLPTLRLVDMNVLLPKEGDKLITISNGGWVRTDGMKCTIKPQANIVTVKYIKDPIGIGSISYVDYALNDIYMKLLSMQSQIVNLSELINKLEKRMVFIENAVNQRHSFLSGALSALAMASTYVNPLLGIAMSMVAEALTIIEMASQGVTAEHMVYVLTNLLDILLAIKTIKPLLPNMIPAAKGKYDVTRATAEAQKQVARVKVDEYKFLGGIHKDPGTLSTHKVQIMHKPLEDFKYGSYFDKILSRMSANIATKQDKLIFSAATKMKVNPTHQYVRTSSVRKDVDGKLIKDVWITGIGDGYSQMVNRSWLGWGNTALIPRKTKGEVSPGAFKICFKESESGKWEVLPHRSSGMTNSEILEASGMTKQGAWLFLEKAMPDEINFEVSEAYNRLVSHYMYNAKTVVTKESNIQLMDGQMEALYNTIKQSSYDHYTYSLVGNNCQHFTTSILKMLEQPNYKPNWMSTPSYVQYINSLDNVFAKFTN